MNSHRVRVEASSPTDGLNGVDLLLNPVKRKDRGRYECKAEIDGRLRTASFELTVLRKLSPFRCCVVSYSTRTDMFSEHHFIDCNCGAMFAEDQMSCACHPRNDTLAYRIDR